MQNFPKDLSPDGGRLKHEDAMWLIGVMCKAEDAAKELLAPYNAAPTTDALKECRYQLASALLLQHSFGAERRMDIVLSLQAKIAAINERLSKVAGQDDASKKVNSDSALLQTVS
jgi:hypothetical protein